MILMMFFLFGNIYYPILSVLCSSRAEEPDPKSIKISLNHCFSSISIEEIEHECCICWKKNNLGEKKKHQHHTKRIFWPCSCILPKITTPSPPKKWTNRKNPLHPLFLLFCSSFYNYVKVKHSGKIFIMKILHFRIFT